MSDEITTRCMICDTGFTEEQIKGVKACPSCGTTSIPLDPSRDRTVRINEHELRILTIWASNWAEKIDEQGPKKSLDAILQRLRAQLPGLALTLADEVRQLQDAGYNASLVKGDGTVLVPEKDEPS